MFEGRVGQGSQKDLQSWKKLNRTSVNFDKNMCKVLQWGGKHPWIRVGE